MKKYILLIIIWTFLSNAVFSQEVKTVSSQRSHVLHGHTFPSQSQFLSSFVNTKLQATMGFGSTSLLQIPGLMIGESELFEFEGKILFVDLDVRYSQRFTPWLSLIISIKMAARVGTDLSTIVADGVNSISGGDIGWNIRFLRREKINLSAVVHVQRLTGNFINVSEYIYEIINNNPYPSIVKKIPAMSVGTGITGAYAFNSTFGIQFQGGLSYGESFQRNTAGFYTTIGAYGDVDFNPKYDVPINFTLGYILTSAPEVVMSDGGYSNVLQAKLAYSGSTDYELGLQFTYYNVHIRSIEEKTYVSKIILLMAFYF